MEKELAREELFLLVWEKPSTEVAKDLAILDVALGKRRKQLQGFDIGIFCQVRFSSRTFPSRAFAY